MKKDVMNRINNTLIVSCQAYEDNPLFGAENMLIMAKCAMEGGAKTLRICWPEQVSLIKKELDVIVIGINKQFDETQDMYSHVFITPTYESAAALADAGCDIIALDGTLRGRTYEDLEIMIKKLKKNYPQIPLMADISTIEEGLACEKIGFDILSSTLSGYTNETKHKGEAPDYQLVEDLVKKTSCFINAEGRIWDRNQVMKMRKLHPHSITIGAAVTNPMKITEHFINAFEEVMVEKL